MIGVVSNRYHKFLDLTKKLGLDEKDCVYLSGGANHMGLYFDRLIFTCGYAELATGYLADLLIRAKPNVREEYISCCYLDHPHP